MTSWDLGHIYKAEQNAYPQKKRTGFLERKALNPVDSHTLWSPGITVGDISVFLPEDGESPGNLI